MCVCVYSLESTGNDAVHFYVSVRLCISVMVRVYASNDKGGDKSNVSFFFFATSGYNESLHNRQEL